MKLLTILFVSLLVILPLAPQEVPELKQASELTEAVVKLINAKKYDEALPLAKRALEIRERLLQRDDPLIGNSLIYLVHIYDGKRDFNKVRETLERLLQYQMTRFGADHVKLAPTLERLAVLYYQDGNKTRAEDSYRRSLASKEKEYGMDHVEVAHTLFRIGELYRALRDFARGSPAYSRALRIYGKRLGVASAEFERTSEGYSCLAYETTKVNVFGEINSIWQIIVTPNGPAQAHAGTILNGKILTVPKPDYPEAAREKRLKGRVIVKVTVDESGNVISAKDMCGGPPYLSESAVRSAYAARIEPAKLSGKPVSVYRVIEYTFVSP